VLKTVDGGVHWTRNSKGIWDTRILGVWLHPDDPQGGHVFAGESPFLVAGTYLYPNNNGGGAGYSWCLVRVVRVVCVVVVVMVIVRCGVVALVLALVLAPTVSSPALNTIRLWNTVCAACTCRPFHTTCHSTHTLVCKSTLDT
jgi:hypothetical protein